MAYWHSSGNRLRVSLSPEGEVGMPDRVEVFHTFPEQMTINQTLFGSVLFCPGVLFDSSLSK